MPTHQQGNRGRQAENDTRKKSQTDKPGRVDRPAGIDAGVVQRARSDPRRLSPAEVLQLQRTIGNRAVSESLSGARPRPVMQAKPLAAALTPLAQSGESLVQRTLTIDPPDGEFAPQLIGDLKKLLAGTKGYELVVGPDGDVTLRRTAYEVENSQPGYTLLARVIRSEKNIKLLSSLNNEKKWKESKTSPVDTEKASNPKEGSDVVMFVNPKMLQKSIVRDTKTGEIKAEDSPSEVVLAHELIHADRSQRGVRATGKGSARVEYPVKGYSNGKIVGTDYGSRAEEVLTVGLEPTGKEKERLETSFGEQDVTENKIREQLGYSPVIVYESDIDAFFKRINTNQFSKTPTDKMKKELPLKKLKKGLEGPDLETNMAPAALKDILEDLRLIWNKMTEKEREQYKEDTLDVLDQYVMRVHRYRPAQALLGEIFEFQGL